MPVTLRFGWMSILVKVLKLVVVLVAVAVLIVVSMWLIGAFNKTIKPGQAERTLRTVGDLPTAPVEEVSKEYYDEAVGTLKAATRTIVSSKILAGIKTVNVAAGDEVKAGDVLIQLVDDEYQARLKQAEDAAQVAQAARIRAESEYQRSIDLFKESPGAISQSRIDEVTAQMQSARAEESRTQQAVVEAKVIPSYTVITAARPGRVVDRLAEPGDTARPGEPLLVIYDEQSLRLEAPVVENLAVKLRIGQPLDVHIDALNQNFKAPVDEIVPQASAASRSFLIKVTMPQSDRLYEGMFGRLQIPAGIRKFLCIPTAAIRTVGQLEFVDVVRKDRTLERRLIKTGSRGRPGHKEVLSGLAAGEQLVLYGKSDDSNAAAPVAPVNEEARHD